MSNGFKRTDKQKQATEILSKSLFCMLYGGGRSGKTFIIVRSIIIRAMSVKSRHLIVRFRFNHAKTSIWHDTFPKVIDICFPHLKSLIKENKSDWFWEFPNGSQIWLGGIDDKDRVEKILGNEYSTIYGNECSQISYDAVTILLTRLAEKNHLRKRFWFDANPPNKKHWTYLLFIANQDPTDKSIRFKQEDYPYLLMNPADNEQNIADEYMEMLDIMPKRKRDRFKHGLFSSDIEGALWTDEMITNARLLRNGDAVKTVVAIDPAVTNKKDSDETGIIVMSKDRDNIGFVEEDLTIKSSPTRWATRAIDAYYRHDANYIVVETNQGGDMVKGTIQAVDNKVKIKEVRATKGKQTRAEPLTVLYELNKISHKSNRLDMLEEEMVSWVPDSGQDSPNRIDALVWASVGLDLTKSVGMYNFG